jgi:FkbM family methyltransferase
VISYEFVPENLKILRRNLALNPAVSGIIQVIERAAWNESDIPLAFEANGPATRVLNNPTGEAVTCVLTLSIDDLVIQNNLPRLDFIKMDIEGAELHALQGATQTLMRFRPKLAIAVYHNLADFFEIPEYLNSLDIGYRFFLRHYTIHAEETVIYAKAN